MTSQWPVVKRSSKRAGAVRPKGIHEMNAKRRSPTYLQLLATGAVIGVAAIFAPAPAAAQDAAAQPDAISVDQLADEEIVVTGSRIPRPDLDSTVPVAVVGAIDLQRDAAVNVQDTLQELPQVGIGSSRTNTNFLTAGNGVATVNLRNLGSDRTLVLVNGRRFIAGLAGTSSVDLNNIPTDFIERIDVVTGGSSAVYGSDAVAGVVNFILKEKFDGVQVRGQYNLTDEGDNPRYFTSITAGTSFGGDDRGSFIGNFSYDKDTGLLSRKRSISAQDCFYDLCGPGAYSSFSPQGRFQLLGATGAAQNAFRGGSLFSFNTDNGLIAGAGAGFNRNAVRRISTPVERYLATGIFNYELVDDIKAFAEVTYARVKSKSEIEPLALANDDIYDGDAQGIGIPIDNPFIPAEVRAAIAARNSDANTANDVRFIGFRRRQNEVFDRSNNNSRDTWRVATGVRGDFLTDWRFELSYVFGHFKDDTSSEDIDNNRYRNALDAEIGPNGQSQCRSAAARAEGCVPINLFGFNTASPAASAYVEAVVPKSEIITNEQHVLSGNVAGNLFRLPAGPVGVAIGAEYRREKSFDDLDVLTNTGGNSGNQIPDTRGKFNVKEVFGELRVPLLAETPFFNYLGVNGAARYSDYSQGNVGSVFSWNAGAEWEPVAGIRFRGVYAKANRAPNISEFASSPAETFAGVNDPCDGVTAGGSTAIDTACRAIPAIARAIAANGAFEYTLADIQGINGFVGGNPDLGEETAKTITAGVVIRPRQVRGLGLTVDYFDIKIKDAIGTVGRNLSVEQCLVTGLPAFCNNVIRDNNTGFVRTVNDQLVNIAGLRTKGIDVGLRYGFPLRAIGDGRLDLTGNYTYLINNKEQANPAAPVRDFAGTVGLSEHKGTARAAYLQGGFTASWQVTYLSKVIGDLDLVDDPDAASLNSVGDRWYHDVQLRYDVGENREFAFYLGVDNLFESKPPFLPGTPFTNSPTGTETAADVYDPFGRRFYVGAQVRF